MQRILTIAALALLIGCAGTPAAQVEEPAMIDFTTLKVPSSPNTWVVAPEGYLTTAKADTAAPVYSQDPDAVFEKLVAIVKATPRTSSVKADPATRHISYSARVAFTVFRDDVDISVIEAGNGGSTLVAYSRSRVGYSDFGVNERRLNSLISKLTAELAK
ncbi:MAG: DUF1499 domain-containing protein [Pseudomonadota bacterium]